MTLEVVYLTQCEMCQTTTLPTNRIKNEEQSHINTVKIFRGKGKKIDQKNVIKKLHQYDVLVMQLELIHLIFTTQNHQKVNGLSN